MDLAPSDVHQRTELYDFGDFALYVPAKVGRVRGVLVALGGPNTKGFAAGTPFGAPFPPVEASLQTLGEMFRDLAADRGLAILGTSRFGATTLPNQPAPWALALERGVVHHSLTPVQRDLTVNWMRTILNVSQRPPVVGWFGDPVTGQIATGAAFRGDPSTASWFPTRAHAEEWAAFIGL